MLTGSCASSWTPAALVFDMGNGDLSSAYQVFSAENGVKSGRHGGILPRGEVKRHTTGLSVNLFPFRRSAFYRVFAQEGICKRSLLLQCRVGTIASQTSVKNEI